MNREVGSICMADDIKKVGRISPAPENFLDAKLTHDITTNGLDKERRGFMLKSFLTASAALIGGSAIAAGKQSGDPNILSLPTHSTTLGKPVAANPYGIPSQYETNLLRRESPGLTRVSGASVSFAPLQGLSLIHISEPTRLVHSSRMPSSA